jgi:hypothetical protein
MKIDKINDIWAGVQCSALIEHPDWDATVVIVRLDRQLSPT